MFLDKSTVLYLDGTQTHFKFSMLDCSKISGEIFKAVYNIGFVFIFDIQKNQSWWRKALYLKVLVRDKQKYKNWSNYLLL